MGETLAKRHRQRTPSSKARSFGIPGIAPPHYKNLLQLKRRGTVCDGITELLKCGDYNYLDRTVPGLTAEQKQEIYRKAFFADVYLTSANAITENGLLFNTDGNSNRVAAIMYGPTSVVVVAGYNKIVADLDEAFLRLRTVASPKNTVRLNCATPCAKTGKCISLNNENSKFGDGCKSPQRICCNYTVTAQQRNKDRIKVIIVGEELGY